MLANRKVYKKYLQEQKNIDTAILEADILKEILEQKGRKVAVYVMQEDTVKEEYYV